MGYTSLGMLLSRCSLALGTDREGAWSRAGRQHTDSATAFKKKERVFPPQSFSNVLH